jgi:hypothetical protein
MTGIQEDKFTMYYTVIGTVDKFQSTWVANAVFAATYGLFKAKMPLIETNRDAQITEITGITTDKTGKRGIMTDKALFIAKRIQSYATVIGNNDLLESVQYTTSDMKQARDTNIVGICDTILAKANANAAGIVTYGVTAQMITDLQAAIAAYVASISKPKNAKAQTKNATENLVQLFKDADDILTKRLDLDIEMFATSKPDFYSQYQTARIIIPTGGTKVAVHGSVAVKGTGEPVKGATLTFSLVTKGLLKGDNSAKDVVKKSADKGNFRLPNLPEGTYQVTIKKIGFKDLVITINVAKGETTVLNVELEMA